MSNNTEMLDSVRRLLGQANTIIAAMSPPGPSTSIEPASSIQIPETVNREPQQVPPASSRTSSLNAIRQIFQPYQRIRPIRRTEGAGRQAQPQRASVVPPKEWIHQFVCLSGPGSTKVPTLLQLESLEEDGLGQAVVTTVTSCDSATLKTLLVEAFPKLGMTEFDLWKSVGGGSGRPLTRIDLGMPIPDVRRLMTKCRGIIYIRPLAELFSIDERTMDTTSPPSIDFVPPVDSINLVEQPDANPPDEQETEYHEHNIRTEQNILESSPNSPFEDLNGNEEHELITLEDFRTSIYNQNPGRQYIAVMRNDFMDQIFGVYKDPDLDLMKKPQLFFVGEPGRDIGGLTREFFYKCFDTIVKAKIDNRYPIFEGNDDHRLPSTDSSLLRAGIFKLVGKIMVHALIHTGVAFIGLSQSVTEYLCIQDIDSSTAISIQNSDISSYEIQQVVEKIDVWTNAVAPSFEDLEDIRNAAFASGYTGPVNYESRFIIKEILKFYYVIDSRKAALEDIKSAFRCTPVLKFLSNRPYLWDSAFPKNSSMKYTALEVISHVEFEGEDWQRFKTYLTEFLQELEEMDKIKDLIVCWTAWPSLPDGKLKIKIEDNGTFQVSTCFNSISVPRHYTRDEFLRFIRMAMNFGGGFGSV